MRIWVDLWCGRLGRTSSMAGESCGRDARTTKSTGRCEDPFVTRGVHPGVTAVEFGQQFPASRVCLVTPMNSQNAILHGRRQWRWLLVVALCIAVAGACSQGDPTAESDRGGLVPKGHPSILLITLDTTRADHLEPYGAGNVDTPSLSRLADNGVVFEHAVATSPVTAPAHASLLTGLYPPRHGVRNNSTHYLPEDVSTLAELLSEAGYRTAAFVSTVILERRYGLDQGFEVYDDDIRSSVAGDERRMTVERPAGTTADRALTWLDALDGDESFFLWVHFYDPHIPYSPPSPWSERYPERAYDGEIAYMDSQIGRLLQHPRVAADDVIAMAIGDHGESLGEHGEKTHGLLVYDSTIRVPWILRLPGGPTGVRIAAPISQVDLVPTIAELVNLDSGTDVDALDGRSLVPLLWGENGTPDRLIFAESEVPFFAYGWSRLRTVREGATKFIDAPVEELYDLQHDPGELSNLAAEHRADVQRLAAEIETWAIRDETADSAVAVDSETVAMLHALGYSGGDPGRPEGMGRGNPVDLMPVHQELQIVGELLASGRPQEAVDRVQNALALDPDNIAALRDLSRGLTQLGSLDEAAAVAAKASAIAPWSAQAALVEADVEYHRGRYQHALDLIDRSLELDDRFLEARLDRSRYLVALGRTEEAVAVLENLLEESPDNSWVALRYAEIVELASGENGAAEQRLRAVLSRNPRFTEAWLLLGTVKKLSGQTSAEIAVYREAIVNGATSSDIAARLALLLAETSDPAAETALREAISASPTVRADLHLALGELLTTGGRTELARQQYATAAAAPARTDGTRNSRGMALLRLGRVDEAETTWLELVRDHPDFGRAWLNLASVSIQRQNWTEGERLARTAIELEPMSAGAWNNLAIALEELGRTSEAEAAYRRAAEIDPKDLRALFNLGILLRISARYDEAAAVQQEVLARNPRHAGAHFELGALFAGPLGDPERAKTHLQATIGADPNHPRARQARAILDRLP
jgi:choline-sulfatase